MEDLRLSKNFHLNEFIKSATAERLGIDNAPATTEHLINLSVLAHAVLQPVREVHGVITLNSGRFGPYLKCENKSARIETSEDIFTIGLNRAVTMIAEAKPGRISSSEIKHLGEHPEDKKPVRVMKGKFGPYIKYKSLNATIPEEKDPNEINMEDALILIEKRREYDKNRKKRKK